MDSLIADFLGFLENAPTAWHVTKLIAEKLRADGFEELREAELWQIEPGGRYYVIRNGSSLCAFIAPDTVPQKALIIASHTDSPGFKLKPNAEFTKENMGMIGVEVYGSPLLTSWFNRDLCIAGRVIIEDSSGNIKEELIHLKEHLAVIPQLAIHLDRNVNDQGLVINKQEHLSALFSLGHFPSLEKILHAKIPLKKLWASDLFLVPVEPPRLVGYDQQMISSYRIDNLSSVHACMNAIAESGDAHENTLKVAAFWDSEEIGSATPQGASSPFISHILERIAYSLGADRGHYLQMLSQSFCVSVDLAHALHPNYVERHEPRHQPLLGKGITVKYNAQGRYASDARSVGRIAQLCSSIGIPMQKFVARSDMPCGTTIGPLHATLTGMSTVDIGCPQLSMHSARELMAAQDHIDMHKLLTALLTNS